MSYDIVNLDVVNLICFYLMINAIIIIIVQINIANRRNIYSRKIVCKTIMYQVFKYISKITFSKES